jgi:hypothetical protein
MEGRTTVPLISRPGTFNEDTIRSSYQFGIDNLSSLDITRPVNVIGHGPMFYVFQDSLMGMIRYKTGQDYYAILPGQSPSVTSSFDTWTQDKVIEHFRNFDLLAGVSGEEQGFPSGIYSRMVIENPDLGLQLFSNIVSNITDTSGITGFLVSHDMCGGLFRIYQLNGGERTRVRGVSDPFNWGGLSDAGMKPVTRAEWILHISNIDVSTIEAARMSRLRRGMCDEAVQKALLLFCLDERDPDLENNLRKTYRDLAKMFSPDVISDPETLEVCEPIIRSIHAAHEVLDTNLKK